MNYVFVITSAPDAFKINKRACARACVSPTVAQLIDVNDDDDDNDISGSY